VSRDVIATLPARSKTALYPAVTHELGVPQPLWLTYVKAAPFWPAAEEQKRSTRATGTRRASAILWNNKGKKTAPT